MDGAVIATARELFECRHYPGVVAVITDALEDEPDCVDLLVIRARAHIKLRRDLDAQADLREIIRLDPTCATAYRLMGELAARRDENESAGIFFREALRLDGDDLEAAEWLLIVETSVRPALRKQPAPVARFARGTKAPESRHAARTDDGPTVPMARGSNRHGDAWKTPAPVVREATMDLDDVLAEELPAPRPRPSGYERTEPQVYAKREETMDLAEGSAPSSHAFEGYPAQIDERGSIPALPPPPNLASLANFNAGSYPVYDPSVHQRRGATTNSEANATIAPPHKPAALAPAIPTRARTSIPELPGFGDYLVDTGILTRERLRAALAYQRSMKVQLSTAIVTLGLATPQRIEWAAVAHQSQLARDRHAHH